MRVGTAGAAVRRLSHARRCATVQPGRAPHHLAPVRLRTPSSLVSGDFLPGAFADSALPQLHNGVVEAALGLHALHRALRAARRRYPAPPPTSRLLPPSFVPTLVSASVVCKTGPSPRRASIVDPHFGRMLPIGPHADQAAEFEEGDP